MHASPPERAPTYAPVRAAASWRSASTAIRATVPITRSACGSEAAGESVRVKTATAMRVPSACSTTPISLRMPGSGARLAGDAVALVGEARGQAVRPDLERHQAPHRRAALRGGGAVGPQGGEQRGHVAGGARVRPGGVARAERVGQARVGQQEALDSRRCSRRRCPRRAPRPCRGSAGGCGWRRAPGRPGAPRPRRRRRRRRRRRPRRCRSPRSPGRPGRAATAGRGPASRRPRSAPKLRRRTVTGRAASRAPASWRRYIAVTTATLNTEAITTGASAPTATSRPVSRSTRVERPVEPERGERPRDALLGAGAAAHASRLSAGRGRVPRGAVGATGAQPPPSTSTSRRIPATSADDRPVVAEPPRDRGGDLERRAGERPPRGARGHDRGLLEQRDGGCRQHEARREVDARGGEQLARREAQRVARGDDRVVRDGRGLAREQHERRARRRSARARSPGRSRARRARRRARPAGG